MAILLSEVEVNVMKYLSIALLARAIQARRWENRMKFFLYRVLNPRPHETEEHQHRSINSKLGF